MVSPALPPRFPRSPTHATTATNNPCCELRAGRATLTGGGGRVETAGVSMVGGCCGIGPTHIQALTALCDESKQRMAAA